MKVSTAFTLSLSAILVGSITPITAQANGAVAAAYMMMNEREEDTPETIQMTGVTNDGFVYAEPYYRSGPEFRICLEQEGKRIVARNAQCMDKIRVRDGFFSLSGYHYEYEPAGEGVTPQDYLDMQFGGNVAEVVGIGNRRSRYVDQLVIFYKTL